MLYSRSSSTSSHRSESSTLGCTRSRRDHSAAPLTAERAMMEQIRSKLEKTQQRLARNQANISSQSRYSSGHSMSNIGSGSHYSLPNSNKPPVRSVYLEDLSLSINSGGDNSTSHSRNASHQRHQVSSRSSRSYGDNDIENRSSSTHRSKNHSSGPPPQTARKNISNIPPSSSSTTYPKSILSSSTRRNASFRSESMDNVAPPPSSRVRFDDLVMTSNPVESEDNDDDENDKEYEWMFQQNAVYEEEEKEDEEEEEWADSYQYPDEAPGLTEQTTGKEPDESVHMRRGSLSSSPIAPSKHRKSPIIEPPKSGTKLSAFERFMRRTRGEKTTVEDKENSVSTVDTSIKSLTSPPRLAFAHPTPSSYINSITTRAKQPTSMFVRPTARAASLSGQRSRPSMSLHKALPPSIGALSGLASGPITFELNTQAFYEIVWEKGEFGFSFQRVYLESQDETRLMYLRMLLNTDRATCSSFQQVHVGDVLIQVGDQKVSELTLDGTGLTKWFTQLTCQTPLRLVFQRMDPMEWEGGVEL